MLSLVIVVLFTICASEILKQRFSTFSGKPKYIGHFQYRAFRIKELVQLDCCQIISSVSFLVS